jgi:hypothetical protein
LAAVREQPVERIADSARRVAEAVFGLDDLPPAAARHSSGAAGSRST